MQGECLNNVCSIARGQAKYAGVFGTLRGIAANEGPKYVLNMINDRRLIDRCLFESNIYITFYLFFQGHCIMELSQDSNDKWHFQLFALGPIKVSKTFTDKRRIVS